MEVEAGMERTKKLCVGFLFVALLAAGPSCGRPIPPEDEGSQIVGMDGPFSPKPGVAAQGEHNFAVLMNNYAKGTPAIQPWAGAWWPYKDFGIATAKHDQRSSFLYSPAGKYDAARGHTTNAQAWETQNHGAFYFEDGQMKQSQGWWGHCNGWSAAAVKFAEPKQSRVVNGIEFGVHDIKALLTEASQVVSADFFGNRIDWHHEYGSPFYWDVAPNQFFLVLTNYMGARKLPILIDQDTGPEVWNQPLAGYRFEAPTPKDYLGQLPNGRYGIKLKAKIWWASDEVGAAETTPAFDFPERKTHHFHSREFWLELHLDGPVAFDSSNRIVSSGSIVVERSGEAFSGGKWLEIGHVHANSVEWFKAFDSCKRCWPDYMWVPYRVIPKSEWTLKPNQTYVNPDIDIDWIITHVLAGIDDNSVPRSVPRTAPSPIPSPVPSPSIVPALPDNGLGAGPR
jgi:hypothetical protein